SSVKQSRLGEGSGDSGWLPFSSVGPAELAGSASCSLVGWSVTPWREITLEGIGLFVPGAEDRTISMNRPRLGTGVGAGSLFTSFLESEFGSSSCTGEV